MDSPNEPVFVVRSMQETRYAMMAVFALQMCEWIAKLDDEILLIHRAHWSSIKAAYLLCRYYPLFIWPIVSWAYIGNHSGDVCIRIMRPIHSLFAPFQFFSQAVMMVRAYAFSGRNRQLLCMLCTCYILLVAVDIWVFCINISAPPPGYYALVGPTGCFANYGAGIMGIRIGISMLASILMDFISLLVVLIYCHFIGSMQGSLGRTFLKQGLGAFAVVLFVNIAAAILFFRPKTFGSGVGLSFMLVISNIMACRIILQLRRKVSTTDTIISRQNSLIVRNALGSHQHSHSSSDVWIM